MRTPPAVERENAIRGTHCQQRERTMDAAALSTTGGEVKPSPFAPRIALLTAIAASLCVPQAAAQPPSTGSAQGYPSKPIRLVVPFAPGGGTDVTARYMAVKLTDRLGQPLVVDNRPAASGVVGADLVAKATPDGHTVLVVSVTFVISAALQKGLPYEVKDFAPVTLLISAPLGLMLHPSLPVKTV